MCRPLLGCALALAILSLPAGADESKLEPPDLERYLRWGPLRVRPGLALTNFGYDDNILSSDENRVGDYKATVTPRLEGLVLFGDMFLTFDGRLDYTAYLENTNQNFFDYAGSGRLTVPFGRFGVFSDFGLRDVRERPVEREDVRRERQENRFAVGVIWQVGWRTELEVARRRNHVRYEDEDDTFAPSERLDRVEQSETVEVRYLLLGRTRLTLDFERRDFHFDRNATRDAGALTLAPGVRFGEGGPLTGKLRLGWSDLDSDDPAVSDLSGIVGDAELAYRFARRTTLRFEFDRSQEFSVTALHRYFRRTELGTQVVHFLNRTFGVEAGASRGRVTFEEGPAPREDDLRRYSAGVRFRLARNSLDRRVEYVFRVTRYRRDSDAAPDTDRTSVGIDAVVGF